MGCRAGYLTPCVMPPDSQPATPPSPTLSNIWITRKSFHILVSVPVPCQCNSARWIKGLFPPSADVRERVSQSLTDNPTAPCRRVAREPPSINILRIWPPQTPRHSRERERERAVKWVREKEREQWGEGRERKKKNVPFGESLLFQSHFRCSRVQ